MPAAKPPLSPETPAPLTAAETRFILKTVRQYYGSDAVVRNWGADPKRLFLHVESDRDIGMAHHECVGLLLCEINRNMVLVDATKRGERVWGNAKLAYRQGIVLTDTAE